MKLNNKGITLVEIIISIALISIVLIFLFSLLITVNDMNKESQVNSTYLVNKALIIKNIEEDIKDATSLSLEECNVGTDIYTNYADANYFDGVDKKFKASLCIKFNINKNSTLEEAYLGIYYYKNKSQYVISYINKSNNIKATRVLPDFQEKNINGDKFKHPITLKIGSSSYSATHTSLSTNFPKFNKELTTFSTISIPIIGSDNKDYTIIIPYSPKTT